MAAPAVKRTPTTKSYRSYKPGEAGSSVDGGTKPRKRGDQTALEQGLKVIYSKTDALSRAKSIRIKDDISRSAASGRAQMVDIVIIPGLGADPTYTFLKRRNPVERKIGTDELTLATSSIKDEARFGPSWVEHESMLQNEVPNSRIMVYQYVSQWWGEGAVDPSIQQIADNLVRSLSYRRKGCEKRPIILIGHSLGGVIIEKAVCRSKIIDLEIFNCITGCIFLGTPFKGSASQALAATVAQTAEIFNMAKYNSLLRLLGADSEELKSLSDEFIRYVNSAGIRIHCFYELQPSDVTKYISGFTSLFGYHKLMLIANEDTSTIVGFDKTSLNCDHANLNKFDSPSDFRWIMLAGETKRMANLAHKNIKARQNTLTERLTESKLEEIRQALYTGVDPEYDLDTIQESRGNQVVEIAGLLFSCDKVMKFLSDTSHSGALWIETPAGMSTEIMAAALVSKMKDLQISIGADLAVPEVAFFLCDDNHEKKSTTLPILKSLIVQLISQSKKLAEYLPQDADHSTTSARGRFGRISYDTVAGLAQPFQNMILDNLTGPVYIVINALNAIDDDSRPKLLNIIGNIVTSSQLRGGEEPKAIKWICLGSSRPDIQQAMSSSLKVSPADLGTTDQFSLALRTLIRGKVERLAKELNYKRDAVFFLRTEIMDRAEGNSTWVDIACSEIESAKPSRAGLRPFVERLKQGLTPLYKQVQKRVFQGVNDKIESTKEILKVLMMTKRPPTLQELAIIADLPEEVQGDVDKIKSFVANCGSFLHMVPDQFDKDLTRVAFLNSTASDHLKNHAKDDLGRLKDKIQDGLIALRCLDYLARTGKAKTSAIPLVEVNGEADADEEQSDHMSLSDTYYEGHNRDSSDKAVKYPAEYWIEHAMAAEEMVVEEFELDGAGFWESKLQDKWWPKLDSLKKLYPTLRHLSSVHLASYFGFGALLDALLGSTVHAKSIDARDSYGRPPLYWAAFNRNLEAVRTLIQHGADVNARSHNSPTGVTALHGAAWGGSLEVVQYLVSKGAILDIHNRRLGTAICPAANKGHLDIVKYLICQGATLLAKPACQLGNVVTATCSGAKKIEIARYLIEEKNCSINIPNGNGEFPLFLAAMGDHLELVELLLAHRANVDSRQSALQEAAGHNQEAILQLLLRYNEDLVIEEPFMLAAAQGHFNLLNHFPRHRLSSELLDSALYVASDNEHEITVKTLLSIGADPNAQGREYGNALQAAAYDGTLPIVRNLLEAGARPNDTGGDYGSAIIAAAFVGNNQVIELLLQYGANPHATPLGRHGNALYASVVGRNPETTKLLLDKHVSPDIYGGPLGYPILAAVAESYSAVMDVLLPVADLNARTENGDTVLILAASKLPDQELKKLLRRGSDVNAVNKQGKTALIAAAEADNYHSVELLLNFRAEVQHISHESGTALQVSAKQGNEFCCDLLIQFGAKVNQVSSKIASPIFLAAAAGNIACYNLLLEHFADTSLPQESFINILDAACEGQNEKVLEAVLDGHPKLLEAQLGKKGTALHKACLGRSQECVDLLLNRGAKVDAPGKKYGTALQAAAYRGNLGFVESLLENGANPSHFGGRFGTPLAAALHSGNEEVIRILIEKSDPYALDNALHYSAHLRRFEDVRLLLEVDDGANVLSTSQWGTVIDAFDSAVTVDEQQNSDDEAEVGIDDAQEAESSHFPQSLTARDKESDVVSWAEDDGDDGLVSAKVRANIGLTSDASFNLWAQNLREYLQDVVQKAKDIGLTPRVGFLSKRTTPNTRSSGSASLGIVDEIENEATLSGPLSENPFLSNLSSPEIEAPTTHEPVGHIKPGGDDAVTHHELSAAETAQRPSPPNNKFTRGNSLPNPNVKALNAAQPVEMGYMTPIQGIQNNFSWPQSGSDHGVDPKMRPESSNNAIERRPVPGRSNSQPTTQSPLTTEDTPVLSPTSSVSSVSLKRSSARHLSSASSSQHTDNGLHRTGNTTHRPGRPSALNWQHRPSLPDAVSARIAEADSRPRSSSAGEDERHSRASETADSSDRKDYGYSLENRPNIYSYPTQYGEEQDEESQQLRERVNDWATMTRSLDTDEGGGNVESDNHQHKNQVQESRVGFSKAMWMSYGEDEDVKTFGRRMGR